ncbi:hypothetical protein [Streptomyces sp. NPDC008125]|uniref:hypothetical protein n=1 Tax=Streptomyces sp. NPDC008125 TaxID=3364811 RepID=UPI0036EDCB56
MATTVPVLTDTGPGAPEQAIGNVVGDWTESEERDSGGDVRRPENEQAHRDMRGRRAYGVASAVVLPVAGTTPWSGDRFSTGNGDPGVIRGELDDRYLPTSAAETVREENLDVPHPVPLALARELGRADDAGLPASSTMPERA